MINDLKKSSCAGYDALAKAIVLQACFDYVDASVKIAYLKSDEALKRYKSYKSAKGSTAKAKANLERETAQVEAILNDVKRFFFSQWYEALCELDPKFLMDTLQEKVDIKLNKKKANATIRKMMKQKGISQEKLGELLGVSQTCVYTMLKTELPNNEKKRLKEIIKNC